VAQTARGEEPAGADEAIRAYARSFDPDAVDVEYANDLFQGAFLIGEKEAQRRRDAGLARLVAEEDRRRHEEESWFLNPRLVLPKEVVRAGKRVARVGLTPIRTATTAGFFVGLHAAPELIPPSVWLPVLLDYPEGEREREFRDQDEAESFFSLLLIAYNATGTALSSGELPLPFSYVSSDPDSVERARDWVDGFLTAFSLCSDTSVVTGHDRGARALFTLDLLHGDEAERFAQRQDRAVDFTPAELRRYALDNLVENVSYIYALAREAGAAYGGPAAEAGPTGTGGPPAPGAPADPAGFIDPSDEGPTHGSDAGSTRGSDTTHQEHLTPQQRRNRRKRRRKK
jgi:yecA family protein